MTVLELTTPVFGQIIANNSRQSSQKVSSQLIHRFVSRIHAARLVIIRVCVQHPVHRIMSIILDREVLRPSAGASHSG